VGYDYTQISGYLISTIVDDRSHRFGGISDGIVVLHDAGTLIGTAWTRLADRFPAIKLDAFVVMPNHFHGIIFIGTDPNHASPSLSRVMHVFKSESAVEYGRGIRAGVFPDVRRALWQRSFHDRIITSSRILKAARDYVKNNPYKWQEEIDRHFASAGSN
jgi:REP element-mobilizing transposase RayT